MAQPAGGPLPRGLSSLVNVAGGFIAASLAPSTRRIYAQAVVQLRDFAVTMFPGHLGFLLRFPYCVFLLLIFSVQGWLLPPLLLGCPPLHFFINYSVFLIRLGISLSGVYF